MAVEYQPTPLPGCEDLAEPTSAAAPDPRETAIDWATGEVFPVHPAAAMFPMLAPDELADLAAHIGDQGLLQAVVLDADRQLIDGRNRLAACAAAEVTPYYTTLPPDIEPVAYILGLNVQRRHLNQSQRAMAVVIGEELCKIAKFGRGQNRALAEAVDAQPARLSQAALVARYAEELARPVIAGAMRLDHAYAEAKARRSELEGRVTEAEQATVNLARLRGAAPDLAALVTDEALSLTEAVAALNQREAEAQEQERIEQERRERVTLSFARATASLHAILHDPLHQIADDWTPTANTMDTVTGLENLWTPEGLADLGEHLMSLARGWCVQDQEGD